MQLSQYVGTTGGRLAFMSAGIALLGGALAILISTPGTSMLALTSALSVAVTGFIAAMVIGIRESQKFVLIGVCFLPPAGGIYFALVQSWRADQASPAGYALLAASVVLLAVAAASKKLKTPD